MKDHLIKLGSALLLLVVGSLLGAVIQSRRDQSAVETRFLDYRVTVNNDLLRTPQVSGRQLQVTLDGQPVEELSEVRVAIYNYSDRHYENLPIFIDIAAEDGSFIGSETLDVLEFLARVASHIPNKGQVLQRYYGWYANQTRGIRRRTATHGQASASAVEVEPVPPSLQEARRRWAELLRRIFEVDPLQCSRCGHEMRIVAFITQPRVIDRILTHLRRIATEPRRSRAPPRRWTSPRTATSA